MSCCTVTGVGGAVLLVLCCAATGGVGVEKVSENNQRNTASQTTGYRREVKYKQYDKK